MQHDWSGEGDERFPFWSRAEILRLGAVAALVIVPVSVSAIDAPAAKRRAEIRQEAVIAIDAGRLISTKHVEFDMTSVDTASFGDEPEPATR